MKEKFNEQLKKYASVIIRTGIAMQKNGKLLIHSPIEAFELTRMIVQEAYKAGALDVQVLWSDQYLELLRYKDGGKESAQYVPEWIARQAEAMVEDGYARIKILGDDPNLLAEIDSDLIDDRNKKVAIAHQKVMSAVTGHYIDWTIAAMSTPSWAKSVYPDLPEEQAVESLWQDIFAVCRINEDDPVAAWKEHTDKLAKISQYLNEKNFASVHFKNAEGTDLTVGLADGHIWDGGAMLGKTNNLTIPNMPTDEVFTAPHRERVNGVAVASKPLSYNGTLIENIKMVFRDGKAVEVSATKGDETIKKLVTVDEGASRLGEVALVPFSSPVSKRKKLFNVTLFDENAASHIAMGRCYSTNIKDGQDVEKLTQAGGNDSLIHVDWMIGSQTTDVNGITATGERIPLMRQGEWVIEF